MKDEFPGPQIHLHNSSPCGRRATAFSSAISQVSPMVLASRSAMTRFSISWAYLGVPGTTPAKWTRSSGKSIKNPFRIRAKFACPPLKSAEILFLVIDAPVPLTPKRPFYVRKICQKRPKIVEVMAVSNDLRQNSRSGLSIRPLLGCSGNSAGDQMQTCPKRRIYCVFDCCRFPHRHNNYVCIQ